MPVHKNGTREAGLGGILRFTVGWGRVYEIVRYRRVLLVNPPLQIPDSRFPIPHSRFPIRFTVGWGRVYEIVSYRRVLLVNPPLQIPDSRFPIPDSPFPIPN
ncbi:MULTISPECIES: hypothetical protein [unclassified Microcoleus]|uniref:hypothetical protein n=1 Tax=unclassified Microcoleus TaxID=2642155 RepID=UPI002FD3D7D8